MSDDLVLMAVVWVFQVTKREDKPEDDGLNLTFNPLSKPNHGHELWVWLNTGLGRLLGGLCSLRFQFEQVYTKTTRADFIKFRRGDNNINLGGGLSCTEAPVKTTTASELKN